MQVEAVAINRIKCRTRETPLLSRCLCVVSPNMAQFLMASLASLDPILIGVAVVTLVKGAPPVWGGGYPIIGHFHRFAGNPVGIIKEGYAACGPVFTMKFLNYNMTFLIGPDAHGAFYRANDEELSQNEPYKFMTPIFGKGIVFDAPLHVKNQQLRFVSSALKANALRTYVPQIIRETEEFLATWPDSGEIDLLEEMARLTILTASRCLLGKEVRENLFEAVASLLKDLDEGINPLAIFFPNLPLPSFRKRDAARVKMGEIFSTVIEARRKAGVKHEDMLQGFMDAEYKDGSRCSDYQITGLLLGTLFAGQHTSSITTTWTLLNAVHHPAVLSRVMAEQVAVLGPTPTDSSAVNFDSIAALDTMHRCMKESLRQYPPLIMLMREAHVPLSVGGHTIPVGHLVFASPAVSMNLPDGSPDCMFPSPDTFDPDRYLPERAEDKKKAFAYNAFGGGMHGCLGEQFAFVQVKTIVSLVLRHFEITPLGPMPAPNYKVMVVGPEQPTMVRIKRRTTPLTA